jgi:hypothetical protein
VFFSCVMSIRLITRRAVAQRWIMARRASMYIDTLLFGPHQRLRSNHRIIWEPRPTTDELSTAGASNKL